MALEQPTKKDRIDKQWDALKHWDGRNKHLGERKLLYQVMDETGEFIIGLLACRFGPDLGQARFGSTLHDGVGVATNKRVLLLDKGLFLSTEVAELPYRNMEAITYSTGVFFAGVRITGRGMANFRMEMIDKKAVMPFVTAVREQIEKMFRPPPASSVQTAPPPSGMDELERLAGLVERGLVTKEEFDGKKREVLGLD